MAITSRLRRLPIPGFPRAGALSLLLLGCEAEFRSISASGSGAYEAALASDGERLAVAWYDDRHDVDEIYLRLLDADLRPITPEFRLTDNGMASYEAAVVFLDGQLAVAWYDKDRDGRLRAQLGLWTADGERIWQRELSSPQANGRVPVLQAVDGQLFAAWIEELPPAVSRQQLTTTAARPESRIMAAWFTLPGSYAHPPFQVSRASTTTWNLNADALPDGSVALVFDAEFETAAPELYLARVGRGEAAVQRVSQDDGEASKYPDIAIRGSRAGLTWFDGKHGNDEVYLAAFDHAAQFASDHSTGATLDARATRVTATAGDSIGAYLSWNGEILGLAWNDDETGDHDIHFQAFDAEARPLRPPQRFAERGTDGRIPAIVPLREGFVLAWNESATAAGHGEHKRSEIRVRYVE